MAPIMRLNDTLIIAFSLLTVSAALMEQFEVMSNDSNLCSSILITAALGAGIITLANTIIITAGQGTAAARQSEKTKTSR